MEKSTTVQIAHRLVEMGGNASPGAVESVAKQAEIENRAMYAIYATAPKLGAATLEFPAVVVIDGEPAKYCKLLDVKQEYADIKCFTISG